MKNISILLVFSLCFLTLSTAQSSPLETPGETYTIEMDSGWNTLSIPASQYGYYTTLDNLKSGASNQCNFRSGNEAYTLEKNPKSMSKISAQRGYVVYVENQQGCELTFDPKNLQHEFEDQNSENEKTAMLDGWKVVSVPEEMTFSEYKNQVIPKCEISANTYRVEPTSFENILIEDNAVLNPKDIYWLKTPGNCVMEMSAYAGAQDKDGTSETSNKDSESDKTSDRFDWQINGIKPGATVGKKEVKEYSFQVQDEKAKLSEAEIALRGKAKNLGDWAWFEHKTKTCSDESPGFCNIASNIDIGAGGGEYIFEVVADLENGTTVTENWTYRETEEHLAGNWEIVKKPNEEESTGLETAKSDGMPKRIDTGNSGYCGTVTLEKSIIENSFTLALDIVVNAGPASESIYLSRSRDGVTEIIHELEPDQELSGNEYEWKVDVKGGDKINLVVSDIVNDCPSDAYVDLKIEDLRTVN